MEVRYNAATEVREGGGMSKGPDLSAFPIPRKGGAKPIALDNPAALTYVEDEKEGKGARLFEPDPVREVDITDPRSVVSASRKSETQPRPPTPEMFRPISTSSGQTVATTVKLDENRYLRLADAGRPGPGRLKRRSIQEMVIEALDEWFAKRGI